MSITLSHESALFLLRQLRADGIDLRHEVDHVALALPSTWHGDRWSAKEFADDRWRWQRPTKNNSLHVLTPSNNHRVKTAHVVNHLCTIDLPSTSILWLDDISSSAGPELLFVQMASTLSLPALVLLGYELCGGFARSASKPIEGLVIDHIPPATSVEKLRDYVRAAKGMRGARRAREALSYVADGAVSAPESLLATIYSLPPTEYGYGMGPIQLNRERMVPSAADPSALHRRYPDILFTFAPLGINYDGEGHLDLAGLEKTACNAALAEDDAQADAMAALSTKHETVRKKYVDDIRRNRELAASGELVLPVTKEDLYGNGSLDSFTRLLLAIARNIFGVDTRKYLDTLDDRELSQGRNALLSSFLPSGAEL